MPAFTILDCEDSVCVLVGMGMIFFHMGFMFGFLSWSHEGACEGGVSMV